MYSSSYKRFETPSSSYQATSRRQITSTIAQGVLLEIKQAFDLFDPNQTSSISYHELKVILRALGFDVKKSEVVQLARQYDVQQTGKIIYEDYIQIMKKKYGQRDPIEQILKAFKLFDVDGRGKIGLADLRKVARELGQSLKQQELLAMIQQFDRDGDGFINEQEFLAIVKPTLL